MPWISVADKLPDDFEEVLFFAEFNHKTSGILVKEIMTGHRNDDGCWMHCCMFFSSQRMKEPVAVTHWMPLPENPK